MASKLEYLQRYMSAAPDAGDKKLRKKKKRVGVSAAVGTASSRVQIVDEDHEWQQDAPSKDVIEQTWEMDAADEERPVVVADGDVIDDPSDLPVYVNAEEYLDELQAKTRTAAAAATTALNGADADDLSPPRKTRVAETSGRPSAANDSDGDASPPRRCRDPVARSSGRAAMTGSDSNDASPPRRPRQQVRSSRRKPSDADDNASPPRRGRDREPSRRTDRTRTDDDDDDASPPRRNRAASDASPPRRNRATSDASPPRRHRAAVHDVADASPPRRSRGRDAASAARTDSVRGSETTASMVAAVPPAVATQQPRPRRTDSLGCDIRESTHRSSSRIDRCRASDASPPRDRNRRKSTSRSRSRGDRGRCSDRDARRDRSRRSRSRSGSRRLHSRTRRRHRSPSRSRGRDRRHASQSRSPRRATGSSHSSRRLRSASHSASPMCHSSRTGDRSDSRRAATSAARDKSPLRRTANDAARKVTTTTTTIATTTAVTASQPSAKEVPVARAGLFTATEFAAEAARKRQQNDLLRSAAAQDLGAHAETVYRDKRGRKLDMLNELVRQQEIADGKREQQARDEYEWGTGAVQKAERVSERERIEQIKRAPFARRDDDPELEQLRKDRKRAFDPINSRVFQDDDVGTTTKSKSKKTKKTKKSTKKPQYAGPPAPPNRFGIQPGYRWDGVVRGTNWEEKLLLRANNESAKGEEAYRYAVADM